MAEVKPNEEFKFYLDMDGVISNFTAQAWPLFTKGKKYEDHEWQKWGQKMEDELGIPPYRFWPTIDRAGTIFWANMPKWEWTDELIKMLGPKNICICTSPSRQPECVFGKRMWLVNNGYANLSYAIIKHKHLMARPGRILIDDTPKKVDKWRAAGGDAILFPQPWNENYAITDRVGYVREQIELIDSKVGCCDA